MDRYYYYTYKTRNTEGYGRAKCYGEFDVVQIMDNIVFNNKKEPVYITFWHEISSEQYEKLGEFNK